MLWGALTGLSLPVEGKERRWTWMSNDLIPSRCSLSGSTKPWDLSSLELYDALEACRQDSQSMRRECAGKIHLCFQLHQSNAQIMWLTLSSAAPSATPLMRPPFSYRNSWWQIAAMPIRSVLFAESLPLSPSAQSLIKESPSRTTSNFSLSIMVASPNKASLGTVSSHVLSHWQTSKN